VNRINFSKLFILCFFVVFIFGGCSGSSGDKTEYLQEGKYYIAYGENIDHPNWSIIQEDSYIRIFSFKKVGYNDYEVVFSGLLFWMDNRNNIIPYNIPARTILLSKIEHYYETKSNSDPYIWIEIFDDKNFDLCSDEFLVELEYYGF